MNEKKLLDIITTLDEAWEKFFDSVLDVEIPISSGEYFMTFQYKLEELKKFVGIKNKTIKREKKNEM